MFAACALFVIACGSGDVSGVNNPDVDRDKDKLLYTVSYVVTNMSGSTVSNFQWDVTSGGTMVSPGPAKTIAIGDSTSFNVNTTGTVTYSISYDINGTTYSGVKTISQPTNPSAMCMTSGGTLYSQHGSVYIIWF
jgi:hypothetical protein